jgi:hypothetical protein
VTRVAWRAWLSASLRGAGWAPTLVFLTHVVASGAFAAYERFPPLDIPMHLLGGMAISFFIGRSYRVAERLGLLGHPVRWMYAVVVPALAGTATVLWEFAEYLSDRYLGTYAQLSLEDTLLDMFLGCLGSLLFLVVHGAASGRVVRVSAAAKDRDA